MYMPSVAGCFYFTLGNIHPKYRSTLNSIQLLALVKVELLETYGMNSILEPMVKDSQKLEEVHIHRSTCTCICNLVHKTVMHNSWIHT